MREPCIVSPQTTVRDAITHMSSALLGQEAISSCVLVVENNQLVGILTERDVVHLSAQLHPLDRLILRQVMTQPVIVLRESDCTNLLTILNQLNQHRIRYLPILDEQDRPVGVVTHESLLRAMSKQTVDRCDRNTADSQTQQANAERTRATRLQDEFLSTMSHELRTPLNAVLGMAEGLYEGIFGPVNAEQFKALQIIECSGTHLLELINNILDLSKIESGQVELEYASVAVAPLCQTSLAFVKQQAFQKHIQLKLQLPPHLPDLWIDERRIRTVLINLLHNAIKFTPEGGHITVEVSLPSGATTPTSLQIAVIDTGIGISPVDLDQLFQLFVQIDSALNRKYEGIGLGLALVKRIVELHGGHVTLTSEVGVGSCFAIHLPCVTSMPFAVFTDRHPAHRSSVEFRSPERIRSPVILLAEDNESNISTMSSYLRAKGYRLLVAKNGQDAIDITRSEQPDLILMDIQMPGMDGLETMRQIRQDLNLANLPIIALTGLAMDGDRDHCLTAGANAYLSKPVKLKQLTVTIQQLLASQEDCL